MLSNANLSHFTEEATLSAKTVANYNFTKDMLNLVSEKLSFITHIKIKKNFFQSYDVNPGVNKKGDAKQNSFSVDVLSKENNSSSLPSISPITVNPGRSVASSNNIDRVGRSIVLTNHLLKSINSEED